MAFNSNLLSILIWLPIAGGALVSLAGGANASRSRWLALAVAIVVFALSVPLLTGYDADARHMQFPESHAGSPPSMPTITWAWTASRCR